MSFFGTNIKKIRVAKKLSQTEFAKIFDLTRSAVGAYEEGRAEAKIDKILEIADYFGIDLNKFLTKKLTLNEIFNYDAKKVTQIWNSNFTSIPFVDSKKIKQYIDNYSSSEFIKRLPKICLPQIDEKFMAFEYSNSEHFFDGDILICKPYEHKPTNEDLYFFIAPDGVSIGGKISLKKKYLEIWLIKSVISRSLHKIETNNKLDEILKKLS
ncbi:MAG: helix-turn-helix transcriptional regulator [Bacteroidales bacterium]|nr:helix-turn-helix transcriptional regulator [Bacteroidales bacterium]